MSEIRNYLNLFAIAIDIQNGTSKVVLYSSELERNNLDGPIVGDATKAIESNNLSYIQKCIQPDDEKEIN